MSYMNQPSFQRLQEIVSERTDRLVFWVGAGLSRPAGLPDWEELRRKLCAEAEHLVDDESDIKQEKFLSTRLASLKIEPNLWVAFQQLRDLLGRTTFAATIRKSLASAVRCKVPATYKAMWRLPVSGFITLNLDRLVARAHSELNPGRNIAEFDGTRIENFAHVLQGIVPFCVNLHGNVDDESSWILAHDDFANLHSRQAFSDFIRAVFMTRHVVFLGISADDPAISTHLQKMKSAGIAVSGHYWITCRKDSATRKWAEQVGIELVTYVSEDDQHTAVEELLDMLVGHLGQDEMPVPFALEREMDSLPDDFDEKIGITQNVEELRVLLNARAREILRTETADAHAKYDKFRKQHAAEIYRCWYIESVPPHNKLLGYELKEELAEGAFGRVFLASRDDDGAQVVVKLLHVDVMRKEGVLNCFRRGVRSMRILSEHNLAGIVPYREAAEIPAFAVMDYVDGPNLREYVEGRHLQGDDWTTRLRIGMELARILRNAHRLPERVMHRDLRPENVMLRHLWTQPDDWEVVLLDFDLSWHQGAEEKSVTLGSESRYGFLAPEQLEPQKGVSTRNAAVDSYGMGMILFFLLSGRAPRYMEHKHTDWEDTLSELARRNRCKRWISLSQRFVRLIARATVHEQSMRWDVVQIADELSRLQYAELHSEEVVAPDLIAEELVARTSKRARGEVLYHWDQDKEAATLEFASGFKVRMWGDPSKEAVVGEFTWMSAGGKEHGAIRKHLAPAAEMCISSLEKAGWKPLANPIFRSDNVHFELMRSARVLHGTLDESAHAVANAAGKFQF